jgi:hypothetical protein
MVQRLYSYVMLIVSTAPANLTNLATDLTATTAIADTVIAWH